MRELPSENMGLPVRFEDFRLDFEIDVQNINNETGVVTMIISPDERRYEVIQHKGETAYQDKFIDLIITEKILFQSMKSQVLGLPGYILAPRIKDSGKYAHDRRGAIKRALQGEPDVRVEPEPKHHEDVNLDNAQVIVFISVDIIGSTQMKEKDSEAYDKAHTHFIEEMVTLVAQFNGDVLKTTGDGFIAVINHPSCTRISDNAIDMSLGIVTHLKSSINPELKAAGLPTIEVRVGADLGWARQKIIGSKATGFSTKEIESHALNRAVKIQELAPPMYPYFGEDLRNYTHVNWLSQTCVMDKSLELNNSEEYRTYGISI